MGEWDRLCEYKEHFCSNDEGSGGVDAKRGGLVKRGGEAFALDGLPMATSLAEHANRR